MASTSAEVDRDGVEGMPVGPVGGVEEALFGGQDPQRGVLLGPGDGEHRRPIPTPQLHRKPGRVLDGGEANRPRQRCVDDQSRHGGQLVGGQVGAAELALRLGPDVPGLPGRPMLLQHRDHPLRHLPYPVRRHHRTGDRRRAQGPGDHGGDLAWPAHHLDGLGVPGGALLGEGAGFVFGVAGFQGGLLGQLNLLHPARRPPMLGGERGGELGRPDLDHPPARRPPGEQRRVDVRRSRGPAAWTGPGPAGPRTAPPAGG